YNCHSSLTKEPMGGLRLDGRDFLLKGGKRGPAVVPGSPEKSLLLRTVNHTAPGLAMPPSGKLTAAQIAHLTTWIRAGAPWPAAVAAVPSGKCRVPSKGRASSELGTRNSEPSSVHWAFQPVRKPAIPAVKNRWWVKNPV